MRQSYVFKGVYRRGKQDVKGECRNVGGQKCGVGGEGQPTGKKVLVRRGKKVLLARDETERYG